MLDQNPISSLALQQAAFAAIKAKHQNLHASLAGKGEPLLLELADMLLLLSGQLALLAGVSLLN